nr:ATP synthase F0 subunit 8 [Microrhagus sp. ZM-2022]
MYQMSPLSWMTLMVYFILIYLIINTLNYFNFKNQIKFSTTPTFKSINWKW